MAMQLLNMVPTSSRGVVWEFIEGDQADTFAIIVSEPRSHYADLLNAVKRTGHGYVELIIRYQDGLDARR